MLHKLEFPFNFDGKHISEVRLDEFIKAKHNLAYARVAKLAKELNFEDFGNIDELSEDRMIEYFSFEAESQQILIESFSQGLPKGAAGELSAIDCAAIADEIKRVTDTHTARFNKESVVAKNPAKKPVPRRKSGKS